MIKNVVFDMGQVLITWSPERLIARQGYTGEDAELLKREVFSCAEWQSLDRGLPSIETCLEGIYRRIPERLWPVTEHFARAWWVEELWPVAGMAEVVREVKGLGYGVYLLSNASSFLHEYFHRIPGSECFDGKIVSADHKLLKPEKEIYRILFDTYALEPSECFFIDDNPANVEAAYQLGMPGTVFFQDIRRLRKELNAVGVPVKLPET